MSPTSELRSRVSDLVRSAEKQLLLGRNELALDHLRRAKELDPENQYILAIIQRAELARQSSVLRRPQETFPAPGHQSSRYLSVTVGAEETQARPGGSSNQEAQAPEETARRIRELTETAQVLLNRGLRESAFDSLMRAYLLDPLHPDVLSCEKKVLPAWENLQRLRETPRTTVAPPATPAERLQTLRREELANRSAKELNLWQRLSGPPPRGAGLDPTPEAEAFPVSPGPRSRKKNR